MVDDLLKPRCAPGRPGRDVIRQRLTKDFSETRSIGAPEPAYLKVQVHRMADQGKIEQAALVSAVDPGRCYPALRAGGTVLLWMSSYQNSIVFRRHRVDDQPGRHNCPQ
jgi:hypothetical protein